VHISSAVSVDTEATLNTNRKILSTGVSHRVTSPVADSVGTRPYRDPVAYFASGPCCPLCNEEMTWVLGPDPAPEVDAHWMCQEGDRWRHIGGEGELAKLSPRDQSGPGR
jgi:hypothetical protein